MVNTMNQYSGLLNNPFAKPKSLTDEEFRQQMIETYTKPKDPGTMYFSPTFKDTEQTITTDFGARQIPSKELTGLFRTGADIEAEQKAAQDKEAAFKASGETVPSGEEVVKAGPIKEINEALAESKPKTMMSKLNSVADKIFNLQDNNPEAYDKIINGLDIYVRGQQGDTIAEAILGNNKFKKEQASALLQSAIAQNNLAKSQFQVLEAQKKATTPGKVEKGELEIAKNIVKKDVDKDDLDAVANFIAGRAKTIQQNTGMSFNEAITLAYQLAQQEGGGLKNVASLYGKEYVIDPEGSVINVDNYSQEEFDAIPKGTMFIYQGERKIKQ